MTLEAVVSIPSTSLSVGWHFTPIIFRWTNLHQIALLAWVLLKVLWEKGKVSMIARLSLGLSFRATNSFIFSSKNHAIHFFSERLRLSHLLITLEIRPLQIPAMIANGRRMKKPNIQMLSITLFILRLIFGFPIIIVFPFYLITCFVNNTQSTLWRARHLQWVVRYT